MSLDGRTGLLGIPSRCKVTATVLISSEVWSNAKSRQCLQLQDSGERSLIQKKYQFFCALSYIDLRVYRHSNKHTSLSFPPLHRCHQRLLRRHTLLHRLSHLFCCCLQFLLQSRPDLVPICIIHRSYNRLNTPVPLILGQLNEPAAYFSCCSRRQWRRRVEYVAQDAFLLA
jgi:hypothetical protein